MDIKKEEKENQYKWKTMIITSLISLVLFITLIMIVVLYSEVISMMAKVIIVIIACGIFGIGLYLAMKGERTIGYYSCPNCNNKFIPATKDYIFGVNLLYKRKLKCPSCGKKCYCKKVMYY